MALFRLTTKRLVVNNGKRFEAGMTVEVAYNASTLPLSTAVKAEILRQFKLRYGIDYPVGYINLNIFDIKKV